MTTILKTYNMQVDVPHRHYGACDYSMPKAMGQWLFDHNLHYHMVGQCLWGAGYDDNGITNQETHYMVRNIPSREDCLAFKIMFPMVDIFISERQE